MGSDFIALINSNGGSETIGGYYFSDQTVSAPQAKKPVRRWLFLLIPLLVLLTGLLIFWISKQNQAVIEQHSTVSSEEIYTQIAETYYAIEAQNLQAETPQPELSVPLPTVPSISDNALAEPTLTFTPWPAGDFQNVEEFIRSYYATLYERNYEKAWLMLSEKMQKACCYTGEDMPMAVFTNYWEKVSTVDVNYAYLQALDVNPAEVNVSLTYHFKDGTLEEAENRFYIITDAARKTLLIDEIR